MAKLHATSSDTKFWPSNPAPSACKGFLQHFQGTIQCLRSLIQAQSFQLPFQVQLPQQLCCRCCCASAVHRWLRPAAATIKGSQRHCQRLAPAFCHSDPREVQSNSSQSNIRSHLKLCMTERESGFRAKQDMLFPPQAAPAWSCTLITVK